MDWRCCLFAPWAGQAIRQVSGWPNAGTGTDPATVLSVVGLGLTARAGVTWPLLFGALILLAGGLWAARTRPLGWLPALWLALTVGGFLLLGLAPDDLKQLVPAASAAALVLAIGAVALWRQGCFAYRALAVAGSLLVGLALIGSLSPLYTDPAYARSDYRAMVARVQADPRPGDAVILDGPGQGEVWSYYAGEDGPGRTICPVSTRCRAAWAGMTPPPRPRSRPSCATHRRIYALFWGEAERDPNRVVETALDAGAFEVSSTWYGDVRFVIYAAPGAPATTPDAVLDLSFGEHITLAGYALDRAVYHPGDALTLSLFWTTDAPAGHALQGLRPPVRRSGRPAPGPARFRAGRRAVSDRGLARPARP